jgi:DMSO/TMAO reductase YedYZ molybdopterin-dependent catalytic subunit
MDIPVEGAVGDALVYHGLPLLEVLEKAGLDLRTMAGQRKSAPAIVVVTARDGYTSVFSVGELLMHRADPRVFLVAETAGGPLPENEGPVRMFVQGDRVRSPYGLKTLEIRYIATNSSAEPKR